MLPRLISMTRQRARRFVGLFTALLLRHAYFCFWYAALFIMLSAAPLSFAFSAIERHAIAIMPRLCERCLLLVYHAAYYAAINLLVILFSLCLIRHVTPYDTCAAALRHKEPPSAGYWGDAARYAGWLLRSAPVCSLAGYWRFGRRLTLLPLLPLLFIVTTPSHAYYYYFHYMPPSLRQNYCLHLFTTPLFIVINTLLLPLLSLLRHAYDSFHYTRHCRRARAILLPYVLLLLLKHYYIYRHITTLLSRRARALERRVLER